MTASIDTFKANLKIAAVARQSELFARADEMDARAVKEGFETAARRRLGALARELREEATRIGDRYYALVAA